MFDGKVGSSRTVSSINRRDVKASTKDLVEKARKERELRAAQRQRSDAAKKVQTFYRKYSAQSKQLNLRRAEFDKKMHEINGFKTLLRSKGASFSPPSEVIILLLRLMSFVFRDYADQARLLPLEMLISDSISSTNDSYNIFSENDAEVLKRSLFLLSRSLQFSLKLLVKNLCESDTASAHQHLAFVTAVVHKSLELSAMQDFADHVFGQLCHSIIALHHASGMTMGAESASPVDTLKKSLFAHLGTLLLRAFDASESGITQKIEIISDTILTIPDLETNSALLHVVRSISNSDAVRKDSRNLLGHFLHAGSSKTSRAHRFYCIANFSHLFLGSLPSTYNATVMDAIRVPWIVAIQSLLQDNIEPQNTSNNTNNAYIDKSWYFQGNTGGKASTTASKNAAVAASSVMHNQGIPLVLYLCRNTPGFPLLLLDTAEPVLTTNVPSSSSGSSSGAGMMDVDTSPRWTSSAEGQDKESLNDAENNRDESSSSAAAWQVQEQEIFNEYIVGDGNRKIEIRISMILNEIARRENKAFVSQQSQLVMEPIESILRVLTNRDVAASLFDILPDTNLPLHTRLAVISVYAKVLISYPYKILDGSSSGNSKQAGVAPATTRDALLTTLAFSRPHAPISLLLWQFLWEHFAAIIPTLLMTEKRHVLSDRMFQQMAVQCQLDTETLYLSLISLIYLFCAIFVQQLAATDDQELFSGTLVSTAVLIDMTKFLRQWFYKIFWVEPTCDFMSSFLHPKENTISYLSVLQYSSLMASTRLFHQLCIRHERRPFLAEADYQWPAFPTHEFELIDPETTADRYYQLDRDNNVLLSAAANKEGDFFVKNPNLQMVLTYIPQVIPFTQRVSLFQNLVDLDKREYFSALSGRMNMDEMIAGGQIVRITVRRDHMLEDALKGLNAIGYRLKGRVQVEFISEQGFQEAGIDGGGLFKEFMDDFAQLISDPSVGLFVSTSEHLLTPNPASSHMLGRNSHNSRRNTRQDRISNSRLLIGGTTTSTTAMDVVDGTDSSLSSSASSSAAAATSNAENAADTAAKSRMKAGNLSNCHHLEIFEFAGKMLGKALYEKILYQSELAPGFLNMLLGRTNSLDDLFHLDSALYRSLMNLKRFAFQEHGNVENLELFFETEWIVNGKSIMEEIISHGSQLKVTNANLLIYIHRLAHFKQNVKIRDQCRAFLKGFRVMIPIEWIRMFNTQELQLLISGDKRRINIEDMQQHVVYGSGYHPSQPYIQSFWQIIQEMSAEDQALLLKFVTSSPRQPLLGFQALTPKFSIQQVSAYSHIPLGSSRQPNEDEEARLPTAATCMNLLKLPLYPTTEMLRDKLLYAIRSHSGFELS